MTKTSKKDPYNNKKQSIKIVKFKQDMNNLFAKLLLRYIPKKSNVLYMDGETGDTTKTIKHLNYNYFVANKYENTCNELKANFPKVVVEFNKIEICLKNVWNKFPFQAAYLDGQYGKFNKTIEVFRAFFNYRVFDVTIPIVFGYTTMLKINRSKKLKKVESALTPIEEFDFEFVQIAQMLNMKILRVKDLEQYCRPHWHNSVIQTQFIIFEPLQSIPVMIKQNEKFCLDKNAFEITQLDSVKDELFEFTQFDSVNDQLFEFTQFDSVTQVVDKKDCKKETLLEIIPVGKNRTPGKCCIVNCKNKMSKKRAVVCDDVQHQKFRCRADDRVRDKRRRQKIVIVADIKE